MRMGITGQLIEACRRNKTRAQIRLFELCYPVLMPVCRRYVSREEAAGMLNLGFYKVLKGLPKYDFTGEERFLQWARRVVINAIIDDLRRNRRYKASHVHQDHATINGIHRGADQNLGDLQLDAEHIHLMISELPEIPRRVFNLYVIDSYTHKEIAGMLEMSENTSRWYLAQARKTLQARLAAYTKQQINVKA